eukprot:3405088-Pyramimonas_sp.AAC.1
MSRSDSRSSKCRLPRSRAVDAWSVAQREYSALRGLAGIQELEAFNMSVGVSRHSPCSGSRCIVPQGIQGPGV